MKELIGKTIEKILVDSEDQAVLQFKTKTGNIIYQTDSDCCSETWFADITGFKALIGGTVLEVTEIETLDVRDSRTRQDYDLVYGYKIKTNKGYADIIYRNSSNGCYGGGCELTDRATLNMVEITEDWSA